MRRISENKVDVGIESGVGADAKLLLLISLSVAVVLINNLPTLLGLWTIAVLVFIASKVGWKNSLFWLVISLAAIWGFMVSQSIFYPYRPRTVLFELIPPGTPILGPLTGGVSVYREGALYGIAQSLRFLTMITAGLTVVWTTSPQRLLAGLGKLGLPFRAGFIVTTALRFIPTIASETGQVLAAMKARGYPLRPSRPWRYLSALFSALTPIIHRNLRRAGMLADSVESRGFCLRTGSSEDRSRRTGRTGITGVLKLAVVIAVLFLIVIKIFHSLALSGIFYNESLSWLYNVDKRFL